MPSNRFTNTPFFFQGQTTVKQFLPKNSKRVRFEVRVSELPAFGTNTDRAVWISTDPNLIARAGLSIAYTRAEVGAGSPPDTYALSWFNIPFVCDDRDFGDGVRQAWFVICSADTGINVVEVIDPTIDYVGSTPKLNTP